MKCLRHLAVWGPDGRLIWTSNSKMRPSLKFNNSFEKARMGEAQFFIERLLHRHGKNEEHLHDPFLMGSIIPLGSEGNKETDRPAFVLELHTEPQLFFKGMTNLRERVWGTTLGVGVLIFLMIYGGIVWTGYLHEIANNQASRMEILSSIARAVGSTLELTELFRIIVEEIRKSVPCDRCGITSFDLKKKNYPEALYFG